MKSTTKGTRTLKNIISVICVVGLLFTLSAGAQSSLGEKLEFPVPGGSGLTVSPSGNYLAVVSGFECLMFAATDDGDARWRGPFSAPNGGFIGTKENPESIQESRRMMPFPIYRWTRLPDAKEALVLNPSTNRAVVLTGNHVDEITTSSEIEWQPLDTETGRLRKCGFDAPRDYADKIQSTYLEIRGPASPSDGFVTPNDTRAANLPDAPFSIADFSPQHDRVLCRPTEDDPLISLNLQTGDRIAFPIHERDRALPRDMSGSFSPDGEYVLMQYSYGPDDHYAGGYLQLFTKDGQFVEEVAEFHKDVGQPVGFHEWLNNNWIVYSNGKELVFQKFIARP